MAVEGPAPAGRTGSRVGALHWQFVLNAAPVALLVLLGLAVTAERLSTAALRRQGLAGLEAARAAAAQAARGYVDGADRALLHLVQAPDTVRAFAALTAAAHATAADPAQLETARDDLRRRLARHYQDVAGVEVGRLLPSGGTAAWLQNLQLAGPLGPDDGLYGAAHAAWHPLLNGLATAAGFADLLLVRVGDGQVVYGAARTPVLQTSLLDGPYADSHLGALVRRLRAAPGTATLWADFAPFLPARGERRAFVGAPLREDGAVIGLVIGALAPAGLAAALPAAGWRELGLGDSGAVTIRGADGTLHAAPRTGVAAGAASDPPAALAHAGGLRGDTPFLGAYLDGRGVSRLASSQPLDSGGLGWRVTAEIDEREVQRGAVALRRQIGALATGLAALLVFGLAAAALWTTAPLRRLVARAARLRAIDPRAHLRVPGGGEVAALAAIVNGLLEQFRAAAGTERRRREAELRGILAVLEDMRSGDCAPRAYAGGEFAALADAINAVGDQLRDRSVAASPSPGTFDAIQAAAAHLRSEAARHLDTLTAAMPTDGPGAQPLRLAEQALAHARAAAVAAEADLETLHGLAQGLATAHRHGAASEQAARALAAHLQAAGGARERLADLATELAVMAVNAALAANGGEAGAPAEAGGRLADAAAAACDQIEDALATAQEATASARASVAEHLLALEQSAAGAGRAQRDAARTRAAVAACLALLEELPAVVRTETDSVAAIAVVRASARRLGHAADVLAREAVAVAPTGADGATLPNDVAAAAVD